NVGDLVCEEDGGLAGGVSAADDGYRVGAAQPRFLMGCGVIHASPLQCLDSRNLQLAISRPGGEHDRPGADLAAVRQLEHMVPALGSQTGHLRRHEKAGTELPGLRACLLWPRSFVRHNAPSWSMRCL